MKPEATINRVRTALLRKMPPGLDLHIGVDYADCWAPGMRYSSVNFRAAIWNAGAELVRVTAPTPAELYRNFVAALGDIVPMRGAKVRQLGPPQAIALEVLG